MSEDKIRVTVDIFGVPYKLTGSSSGSHMRRVAEMVDDQMNRIARGFPRLDTPRIAVLAAVNIADEYVKLLEQYEQKKAGLQQGIAEEHKQLAGRLEQLEREHQSTLSELDAARSRETSTKQEMDKLRDEYAKLKAEFNDWIELVQGDREEQQS